MSKTLTLFTALLAASSLFAQKDTSNYHFLDEVVVTANKLEQKQSTTGKVINVINKSVLEKNAGKTVAQILNEQAGITINGAMNNAGTVQTVYMRGASAGRTLILLDGIPLNDPSTITTDFDLNFFSLNDVESIEVCKGAQSTLYGSDAIAGVINIITNKKNLDKPFELKATISQGNLSTNKTNLQFFGKKNKFRYTARYARLHTNGFSSAYDSTGNKQFDNDAYTGHVANAQIIYQLNPYLSIKTYALFSQYLSSIDAGVFSDDRDYQLNNRSFIGGFNFAYQKGALTLQGNYQYSELTRNYHNDSLHKTNTIFENNTYFGKSQFAEFYASYKLLKNLVVLAGTDYRYFSYNQNFFSISGFGPYSSIFKDTSMFQQALYTTLQYHDESNKLNIELGGRYNHHSRYGNNSTFTVNPSYNINKSFRLFGSISSGFKAPSLYQLSINDKLDAERSINYEAGFSVRTKNSNTRIVFFSRKINNGIDYNYITFKYFNYIRQIVNGIEFEHDWTVFNKLNITTNYTFLSSEEITQNRVTVKDTIRYDYLLRRPKHSFNLTAGMEMFKGFYLSVNGRYVSKRYDVGGYKKADTALDSYVLLGANASYQINNHLKLFADAQNITQKKFFDVRGYNSIPLLYNAGISLVW